MPNNDQANFFPKVKTSNTILKGSCFDLLPRPFEDNT